MPIYCPKKLPAMIIGSDVWTSMKGLSVAQIHLDGNLFADLLQPIHNRPHILR